ncbi:bifunctional 3-demethylubiquinol 3-O-methyltransferase/2-polyprenyl-6-hydroxyphenol methylase [Saccharobesus litoralis]|uniref:Ubiquinone biosynthesis O-methyltransferase n=1 Tax=Saccharobesus litoralis TaxID=2172099 RepID=A0A2S0VXJ1_9ALTE|nr:bifunctional 2-polyprenyl-6-hydroxyphenol methylase/3-demethylubiquinol 3-O-methyltransferase UbiG [Saccharobesus litoralis]AWB68931.1 bifunctional 3-demethylubiquinol 3-O-methyltransferase/2-polyprenyl-6-hydroxyphenol methylase [Saccharobesus litoralis]
MEVKQSTTTPANVDHQEVAKFDEIAHNWWDKEQEFAPLHNINPCRVNFIQHYTNGIFGRTVLDIGCGGGILTTELAKQGAKVTGIDAASQAIGVAKLQAKAEQLNIDYFNTYAEPFAEQNSNKFDVVTCMEMLEHVPEPESVIRSACQMLKPGGDLFCSTLNKTIRSFLLGIVAAEHILNLVPKGTHEHSKFIRPADLIAMIERQGLKVRVVKGLHYNPLTKDASLNDDLAVNYILHATKPV